MECGNNSAVECNLAKVEVAGSNPVSRSIKKRKVKEKVISEKEILMFFPLITF